MEYEPVNDFRGDRPLFLRRGRFLAVVLALSFVFVFWAGTQWGARGVQVSSPSTSASRSPSRIRNSSSSSSQDGSQNEGDTLTKLKASSVLSGIKHGAVATDHEVCSDMGLEILKQGGNAVDASVTVALCLGVANPASSGLGGGAFMLIHADALSDFNNSSLPPFVDAREKSTTNKPRSQSGKTSEVIDCREVAPAAANKGMYQHLPKEASEQGGLAVGVPGELKGLELAHARYGRLPWNQVVQPALDLAESGVRVNANLAHEIRIMASHFRRTPDIDFGLKQLLSKKNSWYSHLTEGDVLQNPALASTLRAIRDGGSDALYKGPRAAELARDIQNSGGIVTQQDIENYRPILRTPLVAHGIQGFSIVGVPPPSSGGAAIIGAARFLAGYSLPVATFADSLSIHRMVEACKHAFSVRMSLSDPVFDEKTVSAAVNDLVTGPYIDKLRRATRDNETLPLQEYGGAKWAQLKDSDAASTATDAKEGDRRRLASRFGYLNDGGTSHFSIVDEDGNAVSMTSSVNTYFGSKVISKSQGIVLSNTMDDFATPGRPNHFGLHPSEDNYIVPGKKPLSSMSPTMVFRRSDDAETLGRLVLVVGASGGPKIISAVFQIFVMSVLLGMPLFEAIIHPRFHDQLIYHGAAVTTLEDTVLEQGVAINVTQRTRNALANRGHNLVSVDYEGTVQAIAIDLETNEYTAGCDVRKGGSPAGY